MADDDVDVTVVDLVRWPRAGRGGLVSLAIVGGVFPILALLFARGIVRPPREITIAAHALQSGDDDRATVRVRRGEEGGQLARTFNVMIDVLRQRERERARHRAMADRDAP